MTLLKIICIIIIVLYLVLYPILQKIKTRRKLKILELQSRNRINNIREDLNADPIFTALRHRRDQFRREHDPTHPDYIHPMYRQHDQFRREHDPTHPDYIHPIHRHYSSSASTVSKQRPQQEEFLKQEDFEL